MSENFTTNTTTLSLSEQCVREGVNRFIKQFLSLFYIIWPSSHTYDDPYDVSNYLVEVSLEYKEK